MKIGLGRKRLTPEPAPVPAPGKDARLEEGGCLIHSGGRFPGNATRLPGCRVPDSLFQKGPQNA